MADHQPRHGDRYADHGLRANPFAAPGHDDVLGDAFVDRGLPTPLPGAGALVQLIGEAGAGKTSQLKHWQTQHPGPYHWVPRNPWHSRWATPPNPDGGIVYGDELDRMPSPVRSRWFRTCAADGATLVAGTHRDLSRPAARAGLHVITHHLGPADHALLQEVIDLRLRSVAIGDNMPEFATADLVHDVLRASAGNLREADVLCHQRLAQHVAHLQ